MGKRTFFRQLPDQGYDARLTDLDAPLRPPGRVAGEPLPTTGGSIDNYRNKNIANTTPIQLVGNAPSVRVLPNNPRRTGLLIQNKDATAALLVGFGVAADINSLSIAAGGYILLDFTCPNSEVYAFSTANIQAVFIDMTRGQ